MNSADRYKCFVVPEGTKKVSYGKDTKLPSQYRGKITQLGTSSTCNLTGTEIYYLLATSFPTLLKYKIIVIIGTTSWSSPMQTCNQAINDHDKELDYLRNQFEMEMAKQF